MSRYSFFVAATLFAAAALPLGAQVHIAASATAADPACDLRGVWNLVSGTEDGVPYPTGFHSYKFISQNRWAWVSRHDNGLGELKTVADTLLAFRTRNGATGTYRVEGNTYTETVEFFPLPQYEGKSFPFSCRVEGNRFYQSGKFPIVSDGKTVKEVMLEEVYQRVDRM